MQSKSILISTRLRIALAIILFTGDMVFSLHIIYSFKMDQIVNNTRKANNNTRINPMSREGGESHSYTHKSTKQMHTAHTPTNLKLEKTNTR